MSSTHPYAVTGFTGSLTGPEDGAYNSARRIWNGDVDRHPKLIAQPRTPDDVAAVLRWAGDRRLPVSVLGGGHNVSGAALCDGVVVDLAELRAVSVDVPGRRAHVQGGARWRDVDAATQAHGLVVPGGVMSLTGVGGLTLGGGLGWLRRSLGLSSDQVTAFDLVTATGEQLRVNGDSDPELFWALRGTGAGLGVITAFEFALNPLGPEVAFVAATYPAERWREVGPAYLTFAERAPDTVTTSVLFGTVPKTPPYPQIAHGQQFMAVVAMFYGDPAEGEHELAPLRTLAGTETWLDLSGRHPYAQVQQMFDANYPEGRPYYWTSSYLDALSADGIEQAVYWSAAAPSPASVVAFWQLGGAIARKGGRGAYGNREAPFLLGIEANSSHVGACRPDDVEWARACRAAFEPFASSDAVYANLPGDQTQTALYKQVDEGVRTRREAVVARIDPQRLFSASR